MSDSGDGGGPPPRGLLGGFSAVAGGALLLGAAVAGAVMTVVRMTGLDDPAQGSAASRPSLYMPKYHPTRSAAADEPDLPQASPSRAVDSGGKASTAHPKTERIT